MANSISITGDLGSGKSTVSKILRERLNYDYIYTGAIQRGIAERYNMTTTELNQYSEQHPEIDEEIDSTFKSLNDAGNLIVDSRLAWFFIPASFKVFLKTNIAVAVKRIANDKERKNEAYSSIEEATKNIVGRKNSENKRYKEIYGVDCADLHNFNLLIDTSFISPEKVAGMILSAYADWQESQTGQTFAYLSPFNLYPTYTVKNFESDRFNELLKNMGIHGFDANYPVDAVHVDSFDYIIDGHKRTCCAIQNQIDLIPVNYLDENTGGRTSPAEIEDWEAFNSFKFLTYPPA
jgi:cytidylate kinase